MVVAVAELIDRFLRCGQVVKRVEFVEAVALQGEVEPLNLPGRGRRAGLGQVCTAFVRAPSVPVHEAARTTRKGRSDQAGEWPADIYR